MNGPLEEKIAMILDDKVCLGVVLTSSLLSCDKSQSSLVDETPGKAFMTIEFLSYYLSKIREVQ